MLPVWALFLIVVDTITAVFSMYLFVAMWLLPQIKHRNTKKQGVYTTFTLYDNGEYRGSISLNLSEILAMLFSALTPEHKEQTKSDKHA